MNEEWAQVSLDFGRFYKEAKSWNVPILGVRGIDAGDLYINGKLVDNNQYDIEGSDIQFKNSLLPEKIDKNTQGYIKINFNAKKLISSRYWLGLIITIIGTVASIAQPVLHYSGLLYVPPLAAEVKSWEFDDTEHVFAVQMVLKNLRETHKKNWKVHLLVRSTGEVDVKDAREDTYRFVGGPFPLDELMEFGAKTSPEFIQKLLDGEQAYIQGCILLVKKNINVSPGFKPANYSTDDVQILGTPRLGGS